MKKIKKVSLSIILMLSVFTLIGVGNVKSYSNSNYRSSSNSVLPTSVKIANNPGTLETGKTYKLNATINPNSATSKTLTWSSSDTKVATVDNNGNVKAVNEGTVKITVKTVNGKTDSVALTIKKANSNSWGGLESSSELTISGNPKVILVGKTATLKASEKNVTWSSDNNKALTIDKNGKITANGIGRAYVTATKNGKSAKVEIQVISMKFKESNLKLAKNSTSTVTVILESANTFNPILYSEVDWKSGNVASFTLKAGGVHLDIADGNGGPKNVFTYTATINSKIAGSGRILFWVDDAYVSTSIQVIEAGEDYSLQCPTITYDSKNNRIATITPGKDISKWGLYYNYGATGKKATWNSINTYSGEKKITMPATSTQGKIVVYGKNGTSRNCYTVPFGIVDGKTSNVTTNNQISCPDVKTSETLVNGGKSFKIKRDGSTVYHTGIAKVDFQIKSNASNKNQYTWIYSLSDLNTWKASKTTSSSFNASLTTSTADYNDRQGLILAMNNDGDVRYCKTDIYSALNFVEKAEIDGVNVYFEKGFSRIELLKEFIRKIPKEYKMATANIFYYTQDTYMKYIKGGQGVAWGANIAEKDGSGDYGRNSVVHEMGHNLDWMYYSLKLNASKKQTSANGYLLTYEMIRKQSDVIELHNKLIKQTSNAKSSCDGYAYLRGYSYSKDYTSNSPYAEFWADIIRYTYINDKYKDSTDICPVNNDIYAIKNKYMDALSAHYNEAVKIRNKYK